MAEADDLHDAIYKLEKAIHLRETELERLKALAAKLKLEAPDYQGALMSDEWADIGPTLAAHEWLTEVGEPRSAPEIADAIRERGVKSRAKNFKETVASTLAGAPHKFRKLHTKQGKVVWEAIPQK